ncbi:MAG: hypothetical protein QXQ16_01930 [Candidatus Aenigmatarchaeota archaeon]
MKSVSLYLEYLLLFLISLSIIYFIYNYYETSKTSLSIIFTGKREDISMRILDFYLKNALNFYNSSESLNLELNGICKYNYSIFYKNSNCFPIFINIDYNGDLIKYDNSYYFYSNNTNLYYKVFKKSPRSFEGCYENKYSYIIQSDYCDFICFGNCRIAIRKIGKILEIISE